MTLEVRLSFINEVSKAGYVKAASEAGIKF